MSVAIVDYGSGNLHSAAKAFERAARELDSATAIKVTSDPAHRKTGRTMPSCTISTYTTALTGSSASSRGLSTAQDLNLGRV